MDIVPSETHFFDYHATGTYSLSTMTVQTLSHSFSTVSGVQKYLKRGNLLGRLRNGVFSSILFDKVYSDRICISISWSFRSL